jgi:hypothetical protein
MYHENDIHQPSLGGLFKTILAFTFIAVYAVMSVNTGDLLWFGPSSVASSLLVHCSEDVAITPTGTSPAGRDRQCQPVGEALGPLSMSQDTTTNTAPALSC